MKQMEFQSQKYEKEQQSAQKDQTKGVIKQKFFNQLLICRPFPKSSSSTLEVAVVSLGHVHLFIIFIAFQILAKSPLFYGLDLLQFQRRLHTNFLPILSLASLFLKLVIISCVFLDHSLQDRKINQKILFQLIQYLRQYLRLAIQLDLSISAIFLITASLISIFNFLGSVLIIGFSLVCLENYSVKKDVLYIGSVKMHILLRLATIIASITTFFCLAVRQSHNSLLIFLLIHLGLALGIAAAYLRKGYMIYKANIPKWSLIFNVIFLNSMLLNMWISYLSQEKFQVLAFSLILTIIVIAIFLHSTIKRKVVESISSCDDIEAQASYLLESLHKSNYSIEVKAQLVGAIALHAKLGCPNPDCYSNNPSIYDNKTQQQCQTDQYYHKRASILNFYVKCRYETHLANSPKDFQALLFYCEFIYNNLNNLGLCLYWVRRLDSNRYLLSLFISIKLNSLIARIKQDNSFFLGQVYTKNLKIEGLIEAEEVHSQITTETENLLFEQMSMWQMLEHENIDLSLLRRHSEQIFSRIEQNWKRWKSISDYVQQSNSWRSQFIFFAKFLMNQRMKSRFFEGPGLSLASDSRRQKDQKAFLSISNLDIFDRDSCCIHTKIHNGEIIIKRVSRYFSDITGYGVDEAVMSNIKIIMPRLIVKGHNQMVIEMSGSGKFYNQDLYSTNRVYILNKEGFIIPVLKMYKELVTAQGHIEYVCFLKKTNERQSIILCDQNFQTHGLTKETVEWIAGDSDQGEFIKCVNLISLIPGLVRHSKFQKNLLPSEHVMPSVKSLSFLKKFEDKDFSSEKQASSTVLHIKSSNILQQGKYQLFYPQSKFQEYAISYQNHISDIDRGDSVKYYKCINRLTNKIMKGEHQRMSCELLLSQIKNGPIHFYQVKLEKLRSRRLYRSNPTLMTPSSSGIELELPISPKESSFNDKIRNFAQEQANIFIKEQNNQTVQTNSYIKYVRTVWVLFFIAFSLVFLSRVILMYSSYDQLSKYTRNQDSTVQASILSSRLANEHQMLLMNVSLPEGVDSSMEIKELTEALKSLINSANMKEVIFDQELGTHSHYPAKLSNQENFDEIDFFYFIEGLVQTLSMGHQIDIETKRHLQTIYIDHQFPSLTICLNQTRDNISRKFDQEQAQIQRDYMGFFLLETLVVLLSLALIIGISYVFFKSMVQMMKIHCHFSPKDNQKVKAYLTNIYNIFKDMQRGQITVDSSQANKQKSPSSQLKRNSANNSELEQRNAPPQGINLNRKIKNIRIGRQIENEKLFYFAKTILTFITITTSAFLVNSHLKSLLSPIQRLQAALSAHYLWIPTHYLTGQIVSFGYSPESVPQFTNQAYSLLLSNLDILRRMPYAANTQFDNSIYSDLNDFYFGNVCHKFQTDTSLGITVEECLTIANSSFQNGVREYSRYQYAAASKIMYEGFTPNLAFVRSYFRSIEVFHVLSDNFIAHLNQQYSELTQETLFQVKIFAISMVVFILMVVFFVKRYVSGYLRKEDHFYRKFYSHMMPQYVITQEKIIKSKLIVIKFL